MPLPDGSLTSFQKGREFCMLKTSVKIFLMFVLVVTIALATSLATYNITKKLTAETPANAADSVRLNTAQETPSQDGQTQPSAIGTADRHPDCYTVRLEGNALSVYVSYDDKEEFMYTTPISKNDLSAQDIQLLQGGMEFDAMPELTGFIENFTS